ncbi:hypothetical protein ACIBG8_34890 [Nonomuraea sp. NPDC050556]|uniref:hypothetical protein n=1 Tax=Nonomuraea sp. NPDC050556 TaxID=3364369 RepID=UPI0037A89FDB
MSEPLPSQNDAVADLRTVARWIIAAAGAVAVLLLGTAPLTAIGKGDFLQALGGLALAMAGVGWAVWSTSEALMPHVATLGALDTRPLASFRALVAAEPEAFFGPFGTSTAELRRGRLLHETVAANLAVAIAGEQDPGRLRTLEQALTDARANVELARRLQRQLLDFIHAWQVRTAVRRARRHTMAGALVVVVGVVLFLTA